MSKKSNSGLKRALAWMLTVAMMAQGCIVYADDFTSEPDAAVVSEAVSEEADTGADSDLEFADDGEDTSTDEDTPDISDEDIDSDITADDQQDADAVGSENPFSDGSDVSTFSDGADAQDETSELKRDIGQFEIANGEYYSYTRLYDAVTVNGKPDWLVKFAIGTYPANGSTVTVKVGDKKGIQYKTIYSSSTKVGSPSWKDQTSNNQGDFQNCVEWKSDNEAVAKVVSSSQYGPYTTGMWIQGISKGEATITSTWKPGKNFTNLGTITNSFKVKVEDADAPVEVDQLFDLEGSPTTPYQIARNGESSIYWRGSNVDYILPEENETMSTCKAKWRVYSETGEITHAFCINFAQMTDLTGKLAFNNNSNTYNNSTYRGSSISSYSAGSTTDVFKRTCKMPADGIYVTGVGGDRVSLVDGNVVYDRVDSNNTMKVYSYCIKNQKVVASSDYYPNVVWSSDNEAVMKPYGKDNYAAPIRSYKAGVATLTGTYQPKDAEGNPDGDPMKLNVKVTVCGFYIDEKAEDGTNTVELSLDDDSLTRKIKCKVIDKTGEAEPTDKIIWSVDDPSIASVDSDGVVKAKAIGETTVNAQYGDSSVAKDSVKIIVKGSGSLKFDKVESKIKKGGTDTIKVTATSNDKTVSNPKITWSIDDDKIATVNNGTITGVSEGTTTVRASWTADNGRTYTQSATVNVVYDGLYMSDAQNEVTMPQGSKQEIVWTIWSMGEQTKGSTGEGYSSSSGLTWKSNDETVATVDSAGVITACDLPEGETTASTTITVSYNKTKVKDITVNVTGNQNVVVKGNPVEVAGTKGESKINSKGEDITDTWEIGYYKDGHGSLNAQFYANGKDNIDIVSTEGAKVSVTGKTPSSDYIYLSHKYYVATENKQLCGVWQTIAIKVTGGETGLYLDKSSVSMKMGESDTATIIGTYIKEDGTELGKDFWANKSNPKLSKLEMVDGDTSIVTAEADEKDGRLLHLTAVSPGETTITIQCYPFKPTATCKVVVTSDARVMLVPDGTLRVLQGGTGTVEARVWDGTQYVENPELTWKSYNTNVATIDEKGVVTGVKKGNALVEATWNNVTSRPTQITVVPNRTVTITTEWNDHDNQDGIRPEKATLQLTANGEPFGDPVELNAENNWTYEWKQLFAEDEEGTNIVYRVTAEDPKEYTAKVTGSADDGFVVTYSHEIAKVDATANVTWDDADNQDGIRPTSVSLQLKNPDGNVGDNVTVKADAEGNWTKTWTDLPKYNAGQAIEYTVEESGLPEGYTFTVSKDEKTGAITVKNSYTPAVKDLTVSAKWDDADNQDGVRPASVDAVLYAGNTATDKTVTLTAEENWTATIKDMPVYTAGKVGEAVNYSLKAAKEVEGYTSTTDGLNLTFSHKTAVTSVTAAIAWDDAENQDGIRPENVSLQLKADGEAVGSKITVDAANDNWTKTWDNLPVNKAGKAIVYTVEESNLRAEYTQATTGTAADGFTITNSYTPKGVDITVSVNWDDAENQDGIRPESVEAELYADNVSTNQKVKLTADSDWKATFEKLAVNKNGKPINYTLSATKVDGYETKTTGSGADGLVLNYTHTVKAIDVKATVQWADGDNKDGVRPNTVSLQLKADGENYGDVITVNAASNWTKTWSGLGEYKAGQKVTYTVEVVGLKGGEDGYTSEVTGDATTGFTVTATHVPAVANVTASIAWDDADNQDAIRPSLVEAELYAGDMSTGKKVKLTADNKWTAAFGEMDLKKDGKEIAYTLVATKVDGYTCTVEGSAAKGLTLKYTHTTYKTDVTVTTKWNDADNQDGIRPGAYSVQLTADGEALGDAITLNEAGNFSKTWTGLEKNKAGKAITYSVKASDIAKGYTAAVENTESGIVVTLTHTPEVAALAVSATWDDAENQDGVRPASVEAEVLANGEATGNKVTLTAEGEWKAAVKDLPVYAAGQKIAYTLKADVDAYTSECTSAADGLVLKFTHKTETVDVTLTTKWNDKDNQDNVRPASYYVQLLADGVKVGDKIILESASDFSKTWTGLQKNRTGKVGEAIVYTAEVTGLPESYETSVSGDAATGLVVTNTYIPATVEIPVSVQWDDADNQDGARIDSVEAELYADGQATGNKVTLNAENGWTDKFAQVDVKKDGTRIKYEIKSTEAAGYTVAATGDILADDGVLLTYKHVPAVVSVSAKAAWSDADNQDGIRPTDTLVQLYADGEVLGDKAVLESEKDWTKTWADLPKYKAGKEIAYTVVASAVNSYSVNVSGSVEEGFTVAYAHSVAKTKVTVKNTWSDLNNVVDSRPSKLVVEIYANGKSTGKRVTLTSANKWTASVSNLDKNAAGKAISYTGKVVSAPSGYSISIKASNGTVTVTSKYTRYTKKLTVKPSKTVLVYNGKTQRPSVTVYNGNKKVSSKYYTVTYKKNKNTGYATVIVKGKSSYAKYAGKAAFIIRPKQMRKPSVKSTAKKTLAVTWTRDAQATKYVVQYSQSSKFTGKTTKSVTISKNTIRSTTLKGLTSGKYYYVRVRSYKVANGKNIYAPSWSQSVRIKVK